MQVAFRTDASAQIGSGHAIRCLTLADALKKRGAQTIFVSRVLPPALKAQIGDRGHEVLILEERQAVPGCGDLAHSGWLGVPQEIDADDTRRALGESPLDWLIVDHYALDERWEAALRTATARLMVIDDLADRPHDCDLLLDQNFRETYEGRYQGLVPGGCALKLGPHFALLQDDYARLRAEARPRESLRRVLIYFGGGNTGGLATLALGAARAAEHPGLMIDVVCPTDPQERRELEEIAAGQANTTLHSALPTLAPLMLSADLAIGAVGATSWERLCLGLPAITVTLASNQIGVAQELQKAGLIQWLGDGDQVRADDISAAIGDAAKDIRHRSKGCMTACDGRGTGRIADALLFPLTLGMEHGSPV